MAFGDDAYYQTDLDIPSGKFGKLVAVPGGPGPAGPPGPPGADSTVPGPPGPAGGLLEFDSVTAFPVTGETGRVYLAKDTGDAYRWDTLAKTNTYVRIAERVESTGIEDSTVVGRSVITAAAPLDARKAVGTPLYIDVAAAPYNVTPAMVNPEIKIQEAIDFAAANGIPEVIVSTPGTYTVDLHVIPGQTSQAAAIWGRSRLKLTMKPGVILKLKDAATLPAGASSGQIISVISPYTTSLSGVKEGWSVEGGVLDGNAAKQTARVLSCGIMLGACKSSTVRNMVVRNVWGNDYVPPGETFHFEANSCRDVSFINCEADGSGGSTATGFSADNSFGVVWSSCTAHDMKVAMGFTAWQCSGLRYIGCHAYSNGSHGFNMERSEDVTYTSCVAGGSSPLIGVGTNTNPWFQAAQQRLGNKGNGWAIHGSDHVTLDGCTGTYNNYGVKVYTNTLSPPKISRWVAVTGCVFKHSVQTDNVFVENSGNGGTDQVDVQITNCIAEATTALTDGVYHYNDAPQFRYHTKPTASGVRFWTTGGGGYSYRWYSGANAGPIVGASLAINPQHQLLTGGRRLNSKKITANYSPAVSDEVLLVDTTGGQVAINLAAAANYGAGATLLIKDVAGYAGTNRISVTAHQELIDGVAFKRISTDYGQLRLMSTGTGWVVIDTHDSVSPVLMDPVIYPQIPGLTPTITGKSAAPDENLNLAGSGAGVVRANGTQVEVKGHTHTVAQVTGAAQWVAVPATATSTGTAGQLAADAAGTFLYVCVATNVWRRVALTTW